MTYPLDEPTIEDLDPDLAATGQRAVREAAASEASARMPAHREAPPQPASVTPLVLPAVDHADARITRTLCDTRVVAHLHATLGITQWHMAWTDAPQFSAGCADPGMIDLTIGADDGETRLRLRLALDLRTWPALAIAAWPDRDAPGARPPADLALRQAVAGVVLEALLERLRRVGFDDPRVLDVRRQRADEQSLSQTNRSHDRMVALSFMLDERRYEAAIVADAGCYDVLDRLARHSASTANATDAHQPVQHTPDLVIPGSLVLGVKRLAVATLNGLEPGDVLLRAAFPSFDATLVIASNDSSAPRARPRAIAAWGVCGLTRVCAAVEIDGQSLVIVKEPNMSEELDPASADAGLAIDDPADPIRIDELELPVQFEIDTVALSLAQLSALGPGYVLELPVPVADAQLRLVAHGQTIGYGELVTVGEHLGIRIIRMAHRHGPIQ